ncbi:MAG TPA: hypothetical protein VHH14_07235, partial [Solirubrobacterales bacterium]|nr:hypothetical protein [Solirubrobacterales bacterium]
MARPIRARSSRARCRTARSSAPAAGSIHFDGTDLARVGAPQAVALGIAQAPEGRRILARQTVRDNLLLG